MELCELTAAEAASHIRTGSLSSAELVEELLTRIEATEGALRAWALVDAEGVRAAARAADAASGHRREAPLLGVPFGVKDVIDTEGLRTAAGFPPFADRVPATDADVVARLRASGALVLGKTVTTQFAHADPPVTANPWLAGRTPGGSSSGSAASVAARQVPFALGTQTGGSVLRPACFCGVVGYKPTRDLLSREGVLPLSWSLDHVGVISRSTADAALILAAATGRAAARPRTEPPRLGLLAAAVDLAEETVAASLRRCAAMLGDAGATVQEVALPWPWELATSVHHVIMQSEAASAHRDLLARHPSAYQPVLRAYLDVGAAIPGQAYVHALRLARRLRFEIAEAAERFDALLLPSSATQAPDTSSTGDSALQSPFSLSGLPSITVPSEVSDLGLPHGLQLVGRLGRDETLLQVAAWCEAAMPAAARPPFAAGVKGAAK